MLYIYILLIEWLVCWLVLSTTDQILPRGRAHPHSPGIDGSASWRLRWWLTQECWGLMWRWVISVGGVYIVPSKGWTTYLMFRILFQPDLLHCKDPFFPQPVQWAWHQGSEHWCVCIPSNLLVTQFSMFTYTGCVNFVECPVFQVLFNLSGFILWTRKQNSLKKATKLLRSPFLLGGVEYVN